MERKTGWFGNLPWVRAYLQRLRDPIIADRSLDLMAAAFWMFISIWGISVTITGLVTVSERTDQWYEKAWGATIGLLCLIAFTCAVAMFFSNSNIEHRINLKRTEMIAGAVAAGFISVYPSFMAIAVFSGDWTRFAPMWATFVYLVIPIWRTRHLYHRIAKLRQIMEDAREVLP